MKNFKISVALDYIFINIIIFLPILMWAKYFTKSPSTALIIALLFLIPTNIIIFYFNYKKQVTSKLNSKLKIDIENYSLSLLSYTKKETLYFFYNIFKPYNCKIKEAKNLIIIKDEFNKTKIYCPLFENENLTFELALKQIAIAKRENPDEIILLCVNVETKTKFKLTNLDNINLKIFNSTDTYKNVFTVCNTYPAIQFTKKSQLKINFKTLYQISFQKTNSKKFFLSGLFLFFCSFFVRSNIYYVLFASVSFLLCFLCFFNNSKITQ